MPKRAPVERDPRLRLPPRLAAMLVGVVIGAAWGAVMWLLAGLGDNDPSGRELAYLMFTLAMIGGGVAAIFGTVGARKRRERLFPRLPYRRYKDK